ncbi:MAG: hypothetical protein MAGBODY4_00476 [Candidatus Marinimicrobia bacterium]|nr:hypothetical protein [Candidatus Neomarinimicrobiota bacterium]
MNLLFVCTAGRQRSPTGAELYRNKGYATDFAGVWGSGSRALTAAKLRWADKIIVMENRHNDFILANFQELVDPEDILVLGIPDIYYRDAPELRQLLEEKIEKRLTEK